LADVFEKVRVGIMNQLLVEQWWLYYAQHIGSGADRDCLCKPTSTGKYRWPGYLGDRYAEKRVLFLGAIHKAGRIFPNPGSGPDAA
jgi:hypothetical protein